MPPKKSLSKQRASSRRIALENIPIYQILSTKQIREPLLDIMPQIQRALKQDPVSLKTSLLNMLVRVCGLEEYSSDIDPENTIGALQQIIQKAYEIKNTEATPLILQERDKFHKEFMKRLRQFLRAAISDEVEVFNDQKVQFNQSFLSWLQILTNSKLRAIRNASIKFTRLLLEEEIMLYEHYHEKRQSKKAFTISKSISYYLEKIISPRFIDIDHSIRETAFDTTSLILQQLEGEVMSDQLLHKIFTPLFEERIEVIEPFMKLVLKLLQRCKNSKPLADYLKEYLNRIFDLSRNTQFTQTNMQALRIIEQLHHQEPTLKILNKDYLVSLLEIYAPPMLLYALHAVVDVFYQSLYKTPEELQVNSPIVLLEIINLLMGVSGQKHMGIIISAFFQAKKRIEPTKIFNIDNLFNLLISQSYRDERNVDVQLKEKEISILISIMIEWIKYCTKSFQHTIKEKQFYEKILQSFNTHILVNCKQLFFEKMTKHQQISEKYLTFFAQIHCPTLVFGEIENYLDFVCEKAEKLFGEDLQNTKVYKEIVNVLYNMSRDQKLMSKYSVKSLITKLPLMTLTREDGEIMTENVYRVSAILGRFPIEQLTTSQNFLRNLIDVFAKSGNDMEKIEIIAIFHFLHHYNFMELFQNSSQTQLTVYKNTRMIILRMYVEILNNSAEHISVKLSAFRGLVYLLKMISSKKFEENIQSARVNAYELSNDDMRVVYEFITRQLFDSDSLDYSSMDLNRMMDKMSLETHEIKADIIRLLFDLFEESYVFACHSESVKFLITMIKAEYELHREVSSRSQSLPMSLDLTKNVENRLNRLLDSYFNEEIKESNGNKLIYWRLSFEVFSHARDDDKFEIILDKLLTSYFSKKKNDVTLKKKATTKIMIFILHAVDKILQRHDYIQLDVYENIFRKISRKVPKQTLIRVKEFLIEKTEGIESNFVQNFLETLQSIAKVQIKKSKKEKESDDENGSQNSEDDENVKVEIVESDDDERRRVEAKQTNIKNKRGRPKLNKPVNVMMEVEEDESDEELEAPERALRSQTKKKIK